MKVQTKVVPDLPPALQDRLRSGERALAKACSSFESTVIKQLIDTGDAGEFYGTGSGSSFVRHLHTTHLADAVASGGGIGIATALFRPLREALRRQIASESAWEQQS
ncbi:MAG: hypothetical protein HPY44_02490 [Armatimonadetes bacterium]|nr:hypothetical protein [Armatimonadota bacterium]